MQTSLVAFICAQWAVLTEALLEWASWASHDWMIILSVHGHRSKNQWMLANLRTHRGKGLSPQCLSRRLVAKEDLRVYNSNKMTKPCQGKGCAIYDSAMYCSQDMPTPVYVVWWWCTPSSVISRILRACFLLCSNPWVSHTGCLCWLSGRGESCSSRSSPKQQWGGAQRSSLTSTRIQQISEVSSPTIPEAAAATTAAGKRLTTPLLDPH